MSKVSSWKKKDFIYGCFGWLWSEVVMSRCSLITKLYFHKIIFSTDYIVIFNGLMIDVICLRAGSRLTDKIVYIQNVHIWIFTVVYIYHFNKLLIKNIPNKFLESDFLSNFFKIFTNDKILLLNLIDN